MKHVRFLDGEAALYELAPGETEEIPSARFTDPVANSPYVEWHTLFDYMEIAARGQQTIDHPAVTYSAPSGQFGFEPGFNAQNYVNTYVLLNHNLGYVPFVLCRMGDDAVPVTEPIQSDTGYYRYVSVIVTSTQVLLKEVVQMGPGTAPAITKTYDVICLKVPETVPGAPPYDILLSGGEAYFKAAYGRFDSTKRYLRTKAAGESGFILPRGKTKDAHGGGIRSISASGVVSSEPDYDGSFSAADLNVYPVSVGDSVEYPGINKVDLFGPDGLVVVDDGRVVLATGRKTACILQTLDITNLVCAFPAPAKDYLYNRVVTASPVDYAVYQACWATLVPEEWTQTIELATLDTNDCDFVLGLVYGAQTSAPAAFGGPTNFRNITKMCPENAWVPALGTIELSVEYGIRRLVHFDIQGDKLVAVLQQSVGGYNTAALFSYDDGSSHDVETPVLFLGERNDTGVSFVQLAFYSEFGTYSVTKTTPSQWGETWTFSNLKFAVGRITGV